MSEAEKIRELEKRIEELQNGKKKDSTKRSAFLTTSGILTIIASCLLTIFAIFLIISGIQDLVYIAAHNSNYDFYTVSFLAAGILATIGFSFGLSAGIFTLNRQNKALAFFGESFLLAVSVTVPFITSSIIFAIFVLPISILSLLGLVFLAVAHNNFLAAPILDAESSENENVGRLHQPAIHSVESEKHSLILFVVILIVGIVISAFGVFFSYYSGAVISGIQNELDASGLSQADQWMYSGSLVWWKNQQITLYQPLSNFLIVAGAFTIVISVVAMIIQTVLDARQLTILVKRKNESHA